MKKVMFRDSMNVWGSIFYEYELLSILPNGAVRLMEVNVFDGEYTGVVVEISGEGFKERFAYMDGLTPTEREHGRCIDMRWEAYHDVYVFEDGYEERYYIGD